MLLEQSVQCQYDSGCSRLTRDPLMLCWQHSSLSSSSSVKDMDSSNLAPRLADSSAPERDGIRPKHPFRDEQIESADAMVDHFRSGGDRCQIRAACGLGKTIMGEMAINELDDDIQNEKGRSGTYVVLAPRVNLSNQLRREYEEDGVLNITDSDGEPIPGTTISVHNESEDGSEDEAIKRFLSDPEPSDRPRIIFAVAHPTTIDKLARLQRETGTTFDAAVFDEAHNYTGAIGKDNGEIPSPRRFLYNEDQNGMQIDRRMFMSATPKSSAAASETRRAPHRPQSSRDNYVSMMEELDSGKTPSSSFAVFQTDEDTFGPVMKSWSYRHAVEKNYLVDPSFHAQGVTVKASQSDGVPTRDSQVSYDGQILKSGEKQLTLGSYQAIASTLETLAGDEASTPGSPRSNTLVFANSTDEAKAVASQDHWSGVADKLSQRYMKSSISDDEAKMILNNPSQFTGDQIKGARLKLLGSNSSLIASDHRSSPKDREMAENWFDKKQPGDRSPCTCGKPGGWCSCARVVTNFDLFSEGLNINSVDTVVFSRPRKNSDEELYQAVGRSSRKWIGKDGEDYKPRARVVIPMAEQVDKSGNRRPILVSQSVQTIRGASRVWRDTGNESWRRMNDINPENANYDPSISVNGLSDSSSTYLSGLAATQLGQREDGSRNMSPSRAILMERSYSKMESKARSEYNKSKPAVKWDSLSPDRRHGLVMTEASKSAGSARSSTADDLINSRASASDVEVAKAYVMDMSLRARRGDYMDEDETLAKEERDKLSQLSSGDRSVAKRAENALRRLRRKMKEES